MKQALHKSTNEAAGRRVDPRAYQCATPKCTQAVEREGAEKCLHCRLVPNGRDERRSPWWSWLAGILPQRRKDAEVTARDSLVCGFLILDRDAEMDVWQRPFGEPKYVRLHFNKMTVRDQLFPVLDTGPLLLQTPAAVRWVSAEPLLEKVDFEHYIMCDGDNVDGEFLEANGWAYDSWSGGFMGPNTHKDSCYAPEPGIHWIVVGGESGPGARPFDIQWARDIIAQCKAAGVPVFVKQLGSDPRGYCSWGNHDEFPPMILDANGVKSSVSGEPGTLCHAFDASWWPCSPRLKSRKGGDPSEWPKDLRIRQWPGEVSDLRVREFPRV